MNANVDVVIYILKKKKNLMPNIDKLPKWTTYLLLVKLGPS